LPVTDFPNTSCWSGSSFSIEHFWYTCKIPLSMCLKAYFCPLFCSISLHACLFTKTHCLHCFFCVVSFEMGTMTLTTLFIFKIVLTIWNPWVLGSACQFQKRSHPRVLGISCTLRTI
jgi:hypothetical protein